MLRAHFVRHQFTHGGVDGETTHVNACLLDESYAPVHAPIVLDIEPRDRGSHG